MNMSSPHPPPSYSQDLAPRDFFPIPEDEIEAQGVTFQSCKSFWDCCINAEGDYFIGDGGE
jgi:hypothetical protein